MILVNEGKLQKFKRRSFKQQRKKYTSEYYKQLYIDKYKLNHDFDSTPGFHPPSECPSCKQFTYSKPFCAKCTERIFGSKTPKQEREYLIHLDRQLKRNPKARYIHVERKLLKESINKSNKLFYGR